MYMLLVRIKQLIDVLLFGIPMTIKLLIRNRQTLYYIPHVGIGDYCVALGYLKAYKAYHAVGHITLVLPEARKEICSFYADYDDVLVLPKHKFTGLVYLASLPVGRYIHLRCARIENVSYTLHMNKSLLFSNPALHVHDCTKIILKIPKCSELTLPSVPDTDIFPFVEDCHLKKGQTILLNPFTSGVAVQELDDAFYCSLAMALKERGFTVATILGSSSQQPINGTAGILASLAESWYLAKWCGWVIGTRSGFFDFIRYSGCNVIAIYNSDYKQREFFSLTQHSEDAKIIEYICEDNHEALIYRIIENVLQSK